MRNLLLPEGSMRRREEGGLQQREPAGGGRGYLMLFCQLGKDEPGGPSEKQERRGKQVDAGRDSI